LLLQIGIGNLVQAIVTVIAMAGDEAVPCPSGNGVFVDLETRCRFRSCQHPTIAQTAVA